MRWVAALWLVVVTAPALAADMHHAEPTAPVALLPGLGAHHHPIASKSAEAQRFFDQGMSLVFAFNHEEAARAFRHAAELDPGSPMPLWGVALALGPNINLDVDPERERAAFDAVQRARKLARKAPARERAYVEALAHRYSDDPKADLKALAVTYKDAMKALVARYPDDLDAATLYAESLMDLHPWQYWNADGTAAAGTEDILATLESVLHRDPDHLGANHYYIHATEASPHPERALASAMRLPSLAPGAGHLVHMPAHVYMRTGDYAAAVRANAQAVAADQAYFAKVGMTPEMYGVMYYTHNFHFLAASAAMAGRDADARRAAEEAVTHAGGLGPASGLDPAMKPMVEMVMPMALFMAVRFGRWGDVLAAPEPDRALAVTHALWHYARGVALVATGKRRAAGAEQKAFVAEQLAVPADAGFGLNSATRVLTIAGAVLDARLAEADGRHALAIAHWREAVTAQEELTYNEPPDWYYPVRESLGGALLRDDEPAEAEVVFRADLARNPRSGRSLFGLAESLRAQKKTDDAALVQGEFEAAWRDADTRLRREGL